MKKVITLLLIIAFSASIIFLGIGCKTEGATQKADETVAQEAGGTAEKWLIVDVPSITPTPYFDRSLVGDEIAAEKFGVEVLQKGPIEFDAAARLQ